MRPRLALALFGGLLAVPAAVFGALTWQQLRADHRDALANLVPRTRNAATQVANEVAARLTAMLEAESRRSLTAFAHWRVEARSDGPTTTGAGTVVAEPQPNVVRYRSQMGASPFGPDGPLAEFASRAGEEDVWIAVYDEYLQVSPMDRLISGGTHEPRTTGTPELLGFVLAELHPDPQVTLARIEAQYGLIAGLETEVRYGTYKWHLVERDGELPAVLGVRQVTVQETLGPTSGADDPLVKAFPELGRGFWALQAFQVDSEWAFRGVVEEAAQALLGPGEHLGFGPPAADESGAAVFAVDALELLDVEGELVALAEFPQAYVRADSSALRSRYRTQVAKFAGLSVMLFLSLATGIGLLIWNVKRELDRAERMRSFTNAVTHELRTPLSTIALHAEMLQEGWATDEEQRREYYQRIARETSRLSRLVERVLEMAQLSRAAERRALVEPEARDLSDAVLACREMLGADLTSDVAFSCERELPPVELTDEALTSILQNLVENARKYAAADTGVDGAAGTAPMQIEVSTRRVGARVALEVADRGPGIAPEDRERVFEPFTRLEDERTRSAPGSGLGLHLVALLARDLGAEVEIDDRPGGGAVFRVLFPPAPPAQAPTNGLD